MTPHSTAKSRIPMASKYRTVAPSGFQAPAYVASWLGDRQNTILHHGFTADQIGLGWWEATLSKTGLSGFTVRIDPFHSGNGKLTRSDLFRLGADASDEDKVLDLLLHVLAWGSGLSRRQNIARLSAFSSPHDRETNTALLLAARDHARGGTAESTRLAYSTLVRSGGGKIPGLGPAFFTKFLYFAGGCAGSVPPLILDARVAGQLYGAGWTELPRSRNKSGWGYSYNWYTDTYVSYCESIARWATNLRGT